MIERIGKICAKHPELNGRRRNGNCPACQRERVRANPSREVQQRRVQTCRPANAAKTPQRNSCAQPANVDCNLRPQVGDRVAIGKAYREMKRRAALRGLTVDHIVPIAGCRVCGLQGRHEPSNWQMIASVDNASKGDRCGGCYGRTKFNKEL